MQTSGAARREKVRSCFKYLRRHCERSEAIHGAARKEEWIASLSLAMTWISRRILDTSLRGVTRGKFQRAKS